LNAYIDFTDARTREREPRGVVGHSPRRLPQPGVVVFESADPDFFLAHYDLAADPAIAEALLNPTGYAAWVDVLVQLSHVAAVTISAIRGIARGAGSEFVLATDIRSRAARKPF
jgi:enoyl-CoA hydratase/carnithine racemase